MIVKKYSGVLLSKHLLFSMFMSPTKNLEVLLYVFSKFKFYI